MKSSLEIALDGTPYLVDDVLAADLTSQLRDLDERVSLLRGSGTLTRETLHRYYGHTRFQQVAESNAIEGSTLNAGETELAILKGVTLTGHDPRYVRDAVSLDVALRKTVELAQQTGPTSRYDVHDLHQLIMGNGAEHRAFRRVPVRLAGSRHVPPADFEGVSKGMDLWDTWSRQHAAVHWLLRSAVLHAWFVHVHPFEDGNGRTARALTTLEIVRAGAPPLILRKTQDRTRYLDALRQSDEGDLAPFLDLLLERQEAALVGLEGAAKEVAGFDVNAERIRKHQVARLQVWNSAVQLLQAVVTEKLESLAATAPAKFDVVAYSRELSLEEYVHLSQDRAVPGTWVFQIRARAAGAGHAAFLAWIGFRTGAMRASGPSDAGPSLFWSIPNQKSFPRWVIVPERHPLNIQECTLEGGDGDAWYVRHGSSVRRFTTLELAKAIVEGVVASLG